MTADILPAAQFDYAGLDAETRIVVQQRTSEIRTIARRAATDIIEIGTKLIDVKERLGHGKFGNWLDREFAWSQDTAGRFMAVASKFSQIPHGAEFAPKALYLLSAPSVPDEAREAAIQRAEAGERITVKAAAQIISDQYATADQLRGPVRAVVMRLAKGEVATAKGILTQINAMSPAGNATLTTLYGDVALPKPCRMSDVRTVCREYLAELQTADRPAPKVGTFGFSQPQSQPEPQPEIVVTATGPGIRSQAAVDKAAEAFVDEVWFFLQIGGGPAGGNQAELKAAKRLLDSLLDLEGFHAKRGRNFDWEALVKWMGEDGENDKEALRRAVEIARAQLLAHLATLPAPQPEPQPEPAPAADLPAIVIRWLAEKIEENELPDDREAERLVLQTIITSRSNGGAPAWRSLKTFSAWPAGTQDGAKIDAVKAALTQIATRPTPAAPQYTPAPLAYARPLASPTEMLKQLGKQADQLHALRVAVDKALGYLKSLAGHQDQPDADLIETIAALERARRDA